MKHKNAKLSRISHRSRETVNNSIAVPPQRFFSPVPPSYPPNVSPAHSCDSHNIKKSATPDALSQYLFCYIYLWLNDTSETFWAYPIVIDENLLHAYIWKNYEWVYTYLYLSQIEGFY